MTIINHYIVKFFLKIWFLCLTGFFVLFNVVDFIEKIGNFLDKEIPFSTISLFFVYQAPKIIGLMAPIAVLIASIITITILARNSEIIAFKAGGINLYKLSKPLVIITLIISILMFLLANIIAPKTTTLANKIWDGEVKDRLVKNLIVEDVWLKSASVIQHLTIYNEETSTVKDLNIIFYDKNFNLTERIQAKTASYKNNKLYLLDVTKKKYSFLNNETPLKNFEIIKYENLTLNNWEKPPNNLALLATQKSDELSIGDLWRTIKRLKKEGISASKQKVDLQFKFSFALIPLIMLILGLPLAFWKEKGGSIALGIFLGLVLAFIYLVLLEVFKILGYSQLLPPFISAWVPNIIFLLFGIYLFSYIKQ